MHATERRLLTTQSEAESRELSKRFHRVSKGSFHRIERYAEIVRFDNSNVRRATTRAGKEREFSRLLLYLSRITVRRQRGERGKLYCTVRRGYWKFFYPYTLILSRKDYTKVF